LGEAGNTTGKPETGNRKNALDPRCQKKKSESRPAQTIVALLSLFFFFFFFFFDTGNTDNRRLSLFFF
jgi:hypothetical protein